LSKFKQAAARSLCDSWASCITFLWIAIKETAVVGLLKWAKLTFLSSVEEKLLILVRAAVICFTATKSGSQLVRDARGIWNWNAPFHAMSRQLSTYGLKRRYFQYNGRLNVFTLELFRYARHHLRERVPWPLAGPTYVIAHGSVQLTGFQLWTDAGMIISVLSYRYKIIVTCTEDNNIHLQID